MYVTVTNFFPKINEDVLILINNEEYIIRRVLGTNSSPYWYVEPNNPLRSILNTSILDNDMIQQCKRIPIVNLDDNLELTLFDLYQSYIQTKLKYPLYFFRHNLFTFKFISSHSLTKPHSR